jgi:hypothetical protein
MKAGQELPLERPQRHFGNGSQFLIRDYTLVVVAHVGQRRLEPRDGSARKTVRSQRARDSGRADDRAFCIEHGNFVGDVPGRHAFKFTDAFDPVDDAVAGQNLFVIETELIGHERRGQIVVGLAQNLLCTDQTVHARMIEGIFDEESTIHPKITALPILPPRQHALNKIEKLGQMKWVVHFVDCSLVYRGKRDNRKSYFVDDTFLLNPFTDES